MILAVSVMHVMFLIERDIVGFLCAMHVFEVRALSSYPRLPFLCTI